MLQSIYKQISRTSGRWNSLVAPLTSVVLCGCAVVHPYVKPLSQPDWSKGLPAVVDKGNELTTNLVNMRQSVHNFDFWSGALLIGTGIGTAGLGVYGAGRDVITGTAIGAGTIVAGRTYVPMAERQKIYSTAVSAVQAALTNAIGQDAFALRNVPPRPHDFGSLDSDFTASAGEKLTTFQSLALLQTRAALDDAHHAEELLASAEAQVQQSKLDLPHTLFETLSDIVTTVNSQIASEVLDPNAALAAATNKLGARNKQISIDIDQANKLLDRAEDKASMAGNATRLSLDSAEKFQSQGFDGKFQNLGEMIETDKRRLHDLEVLTGHFSY
jgi:hypothetical protein